jgi:hypothetical protein
MIRSGESYVIGATVASSRGERGTAICTGASCGCFVAAIMANDPNPRKAANQLRRAAAQCFLESFEAARIASARLWISKADFERTGDLDPSRPRVLQAHRQHLTGNHTRGRSRRPEPDRPRAPPHPAARAAAPAVVLWTRQPTASLRSNCQYRRYARVCGWCELCNSLDASMLSRAFL